MGLTYHRTAQHGAESGLSVDTSTTAVAHPHSEPLDLHVDQPPGRSPSRSRTAAWSARSWSRSRPRSRSRSRSRSTYNSGRL